MADAAVQPCADQRFFVERPDAKPLKRQVFCDQRPFRLHQLVVDSDDLDQIANLTKKGCQSALSLRPGGIDGDEPADLRRVKAAILKHGDIEGGE